MRTLDSVWFDPKQVLANKQIIIKITYQVLKQLSGRAVLCRQCSALSSTVLICQLWEASSLVSRLLLWVDGG
jgi:hypothetical protein